MEVIDLLTLVGGMMLGVISYFLKRTMDELKEVKSVAYDAKNELSVLKNDHINKYDHLTDKFDTLCESVKDLTKEIKELNKELNKKKD
jgi:peptidoglycan hydrolase CwlO-like protein